MSEQAVRGWPLGESRHLQFLRENALSIAALTLFAFSFAGQTLTGLHVANDEARQHGAAILTLGAYLRSGAFVEATFENWESEFLQMGLFVILTKYLRQRGSSESKPLPADGKPSDGPEDDDPRNAAEDPKAPWPVRRGGWVLKVYERSLSIALFSLFAMSVVLHAVGGASKYNEDALRHGEATVSTLGYLGTSQFWFESFQNWQSEFLSIAVLIVLSIFLRERGSPQSKPVASPHGATGC